MSDENDRQAEAKVTAEWLHRQVKNGRIEFNSVHRRMGFPTMMATLLRTLMNKRPQRQEAPFEVASYAERLDRTSESQIADAALTKAWLPVYRQHMMSRRGR